MKEVKYIPGDLVNLNGNIAKVTSVTPDLVKGNIEMGSSNGWHFTAHYKDFTDALLGIPITPRILEKNGWRKDYCIGNEDRYTKYDFLYFSYYRNDNTTKLFVKGLTLLSNIKYVHQLQHFLFGLGLPMDLKV